MQRIMEFRWIYSKQLEKSLNKVLEEHPQWKIDKIAVSSFGSELVAVVVFEKKEDCDDHVAEMAEFSPTERD